MVSNKSLNTLLYCALEYYAGLETQASDDLALRSLEDELGNVRDRFDAGLLSAFGKHHGTIVEAISGMREAQAHISKVHSSVQVRDPYIDDSLENIDFENMDISTANKDIYGNIGVFYEHESAERAKLVKELEVTGTSPLLLHPTRATDNCNHCHNQSQANGRDRSNVEHGSPKAVAKHCQQSWNTWQEF